MRRHSSAFLHQRDVAQVKQTRQCKVSDYSLTTTIAFTFHLPTSLDLAIEYT